MEQTKTTQPTPTEQPAKPVAKGFCFGMVADDGTIIESAGTTKGAAVDDDGRLHAAQEQCNE